MILFLLLLNWQSSSLERQLASIEKQKNSVRQQLKLAPAIQRSFFITDEPVDSSACPPLPAIRRQALVDSASRKAGVSADLLTAVIQQESGFRPCAVSEKGAMGLMQLMPSTAIDLGVQDAFDPDQNVEAGAALLKTLLHRYGGDLNRVLGAYNAGPKRVDEAGGVPAIPETMQYVKRILSALGTDPTASEQVVHREEDHDEEEEEAACNNRLR
jgi:soluble lytic murein transglycosylase-like protein